MKKIEVTKQGILTNRAILEDAEADAWLNEGIANNWFGLPERPEMIDGFDQQGRPAKVPSGFMLPAEYVVVTTDITAEIALEKANEEAKKLIKKSLVDKLKVGGLSLKEVNDLLREML